MNVTSRVLRGAAGALLLGGGALGAAGAADAAPAQATPAAVADGAPQCGPNTWIGYLVPDSPPGGANFHDACVNHDACYGSERDRLDCDNTFRDELHGACDAAGAGDSCHGLANVYYGAVRQFGGSHYTGSGANN